MIDEERRAPDYEHLSANKLFRVSVSVFLTLLLLFVLVLTLAAWYTVMTL